MTDTVTVTDSEKITVKVSVTVTASKVTWPFSLLIQIALKAKIFDDWIII